MEAVEEETQRAGEIKGALCCAYSIIPMPRSGSKSAIATLALAPLAARQALQVISDRQEYPQAADARGMMRAVDDGTFTPS